MRREDPLQNSRNWSFFNRTSLGWKIADTGRILAELVWIDVKFILLSIDTKTL